MHRHRDTTSPADVAAEAGGLLVGLGILTFQLFPFALPLLVLVVAPVALLALPLVVLAGLVLVLVWIVRRLLARAERSAPLRLDTRREAGQQL